MKWLGKLSKKKKKTYSIDNQYKLLIIDENAEFLHENLGISDERAIELSKICLKAIDNNNLLYITLGEIVSECKHTNEIVFSMLILNRVTNTLNSEKISINQFR